MKVGVVGLGYVGLGIAIVLAEQGNEVIGVEIDEGKVEKIRKGIPTMFEPGIKEHIEKALPNLSVSTNYSTLSGARFLYIAVPTPTVNNRIDLSYVERAALSIKAASPSSTIVIKSTVVPGTAQKITELTGMDVVSNPEFTREGRAIEDTLHPDRIVIGAGKQKLIDGLKELWAFTGAPVLETNNVNAELIKYASNGFLATKISFANELADLCEKIPGCDIEVVARGMGMDKRIGPAFLGAGLGWGGSCFPKDTMALLAFAGENQVHLNIVSAAIEQNDLRILHATTLLKKIAGENLSGKRIAVLGVAFKDDTDDTRSSKSIELINHLAEYGVAVNVYDPIAKYNGKGRRFDSLSECVEKSDMVVIATEWAGFRSALKGVEKPILDMRRILDLREYPNIDAVGLGKESRRTKV